jgi:hypothetical protein
MMIVVDDLPAYAPMRRLTELEIGPITFRPN